MQDINFYQNHLNRVSRSFAFCIARLESPLRSWVSLSYLLCRALDTIEDAPWASRYTQKQSFKEFTGFLVQDPLPEQVENFVSALPVAIADGEKQLMNDLALLLKDFHAMPERARGPLREAILSMGRGMQFFQGRRLHSLQEVNQYCFFVAGLVGELLTHLVFEASPHLKLPINIKVQAHQFGIFLQKINLLKDQKEDEAEGRFLIHSRPEVLASLRKDAEAAFAYLRSLPKEARGYRMFCAISLFLGLDALPWFQKGWLAGVLGKIPRAISEQLFIQLEKVIDSEEALLELFEAKVKILPLGQVQKAASLVPVQIPAWFGELYSVSDLSANHLEALGMLS